MPKRKRLRASTREVQVPGTLTSVSTTCACTRSPRIVRWEYDYPLERIICNYAYDFGRSRMVHETWQGKETWNCEPQLIVSVVKLGITCRCSQALVFKSDLNS